MYRPLVFLRLGGILFLTCGLLFAACSPKLDPAGHYQDTPVTADGIPNEWKMPLRFSNSSYTVQYNVTNDDKNLYVAVSSEIDNTMLRILRSGMTLYFDTKGKKNRDISLHFPIQKQAEAGNYRGHPNANTNRDTRKEELLLQSDYYNTNGFVGMENGQ